MEEEHKPVEDWTLADATDAFAATYRSLKEEPPYEDNLPFLCIVDETGHSTVMALALPGNPALYIETVMATVPERPRYVVFQTDAYHMVGTLKPGERMRPGILAEWFAADDPRVVEALMVTGVDREGLLEARCYPYRVTGDQFEWLPEGPHRAQLGVLTGNVPDGLRAAMHRWDERHEVTDD